MNRIDMTTYGLQKNSFSLSSAYQELYQIGRVTVQERDVYRLVTCKGERLAELSGRLRHSVQSPLGFPAVGDFVTVRADDVDGHALIQEVLPRKSLFVRKSAGTSRTEQVIAANIDTVFICMSLNGDFNLRRLERYLAVVWSSGARPVVMLTKADLCAAPESCIHEAALLSAGTDVIAVSSLSEKGYEAVLPYIQPGKTVAFTGSSGVGKSTLINRLLGENRLLTNGLRNDDKGRHTTTRRALFLLPQGGMVIDTPGMRELGLWEADDGLNRSFADVELLTASCRFRNCTHTVEPGCAVQKALSDGTLLPERWVSYQKLTAENRYAANGDTYLQQKKQKFKAIALDNKNTAKRKEHQS